MNMSYFCINKDNIDVNGLFPFHLVVYESDIYALKWFKEVQMYAEKVAARNDPPQQSSGGSSSPTPPHPTPPHSTLKSWQVCIWKWRDTDRV